MVIEHLEAFNEHSTERLLAGFTADAVWATGRDTCRGRSQLAGLFDAGLWELNPSLTLSTLLCDGDAVAVELLEELEVDGERRRFAIAAFFQIRDGLIHAAKVYREGSADIDGRSAAAPAQTDREGEASLPSPEYADSAQRGR